MLKMVLHVLPLIVQLTLIIMILKKMTEEVMNVMIHISISNVHHIHIASLNAFLPCRQCIVVD